MRKVKHYFGKQLQSGKCFKRFWIAFLSTAFAAFSVICRRYARKSLEGARKINVVVVAALFGYFGQRKTVGVYVYQKTRLIYPYFV